MAPQSITDYERKRLENIKRNEQMMASLKVHSKSLELTSAIKRHRTEICRTVTRSSTRNTSSVKTPFQEAYNGHPMEHRVLIDTVMDLSKIYDPEKKMVVNGDSLSWMDLKPETERLMYGLGTTMEFFPCKDQSLLVAGSDHGGIVLWDADYDGDESEGLHWFKYHKDQISGISIDKFSLSKVFSSGYDGLLQALDFKKESLDVVYSSDNAISCLSQRPQDETSLYFSEAFGMVNVLDTRAGILSSSWKLHDDEINTIDFHPEKTSLMATSSADGNVCLWDLRNSPKSLKVIKDETSISSAFFSPNGTALAISMYNQVKLLKGSDFMDESTIYKIDRLGKKISCSRAIWGCNDSYLFFGHSNREVDVIYTDGNVGKLRSPKFQFVPRLLSAHPHKVGTLAAASGIGWLCLLTERYAY